MDKKDIKRFRKPTGKTTEILKAAIKQLMEGSDRIAFFIALDYKQARYIVDLAAILGFRFTFNTLTGAMTFENGRELRFKPVAARLDWLRGITAACHVDHAVWEHASLPYIDELRWLIKYRENANG